MCSLQLPSFSSRLANFPFSAHNIFLAALTASRKVQKKAQILVTAQISLSHWQQKKLLHFTFSISSGHKKPHTVCIWRIIFILRPHRCWQKMRSAAFLPRGSLFTPQSTITRKTLWAIWYLGTLRGTFCDTKHNTKKSWTNSPDYLRWGTLDY